MGNKLSAGRARETLGTSLLSYGVPMGLDLSPKR